MRARIQSSRITEHGQRLRIVINDASAAQLGEEADVTATLGEEALKSPSQEWMVNGIQIREGSTAESVLSCAYDGMLGEHDEHDELPPIPDNTPRLGATRCMDYDESQLRFIHHSMSTQPLIYLDAAAGTGKTSSLVMAAELCVQRNHIVVLASETNCAVGVAIDKLEEIRTMRTQVVRFVSDPDAMTTRCDLLAQILDHGRSREASYPFRTQTEQLFKDLTARAKIKARFPDRSQMNANESLAFDNIEKSIRDAVHECTEEVLLKMPPNIIGVTLDSLINKMSNSNDPLYKYLETACAFGTSGRLTVLVDEASQASEGAMMALCALLPGAYHRYIGDAAQLQPYCLVSRPVFDKNFGAHGIAAVPAHHDAHRPPPASLPHLGGVPPLLRRHTPCRDRGGGARRAVPPRRPGASLRARRRERHRAASEHGLPTERGGGGRHCTPRAHDHPLHRQAARARLLRGPGRPLQGALPGFGDKRVVP